MLTIVIPAYNHEAYVIECLAAARELALPGVKVLIIDDGSKDATLSVVRQYMAEYPSDSVDVIAKSNGGLVSSLILALSIVDTAYFYIVASDDVPIAQGLMACVGLLEKNPDAQFCIAGGVNYFPENPTLDSPVYGEGHSRFFALPESKRSQALFLDYPQPILLQSTVFRTSALRAIGGWDHNLLLDDYPTFVKMLTRYPVVGKDFLFKPDTWVVKYRQHGTNSYKNVERHFFIVKQMFDTLAPYDLHAKALGKVLILHFLGAVRSGQIKKGTHLLKGHSVQVYWQAALYLVRFTVRYISVKIKR